jgi:hypothetical protein
VRIHGRLRLFASASAEPVREATKKFKEPGMIRFWHTALLPEIVPRQLSRD